jgi:small ligand-binding sensory domain FIST
MRFFESLSTEGESSAAIAQVCSGAVREFEDGAPDLGFVFFSSHHADQAAMLAEEIARCTGVRHLLGCMGESIIGGGRELESTPSLTLWMARLPGVTVSPFSVDCCQTPDGFCFPTEPAGFFSDQPDDGVALLLGEPYTMPIDAYLRRFNEDYPGIPIVGGMASGAQYPGRNILVFDGEVRNEGAIGVHLSGDIRTRMIVSQGCRPIGCRFVVTACEKNAIHQLGGKPAIASVQGMFEKVTDEDRALFQSAPHVGIVINEGQPTFGPGDFLIRNVVGADPERGSIFISDYVRRGQTVQFHVRDASTADEELRSLLDREAESRDGASPRGGLIFSCNGRGSRLFSCEDHDIRALRQTVGEIPVSGFFAQGEIGPVGPNNHLHGFTACVALFYER